MSKDYEFFTPTDYFNYRRFQQINNHVDNVIHKVKHRLSEVELQPVKIRTLPIDSMRDLVTKVDATYEFIRKELESRKKVEREAQKTNNNMVMNGILEAVNKITSLMEEQKTLTKHLYKEQKVKIKNEEAKGSLLNDEKQKKQAVEKVASAEEPQNDDQSLVFIQVQLSTLLEGQGKIEKRLNELQEEYNQQQKETEVTLNFLAENMEKDFTLRANANKKTIEDINEKISSLIMEKETLSSRLNELTHLVHEISTYGTLNSNVELLTRERDMDEQINGSTEMYSDESISLERVISSRNSQSSLKSAESGISEGTAIVELQMKAGRRTSQAVICQNVNENRMHLKENLQQHSESLPSHESSAAKPGTSQRTNEINSDVVTRM